MTIDQFFERVEHEFLLKKLMGVQQANYQCKNCSNKFINENYFRILTLEVLSSVKESLNHYQEPEELTGENKLNCSVCNKSTTAIRYCTFKYLPEVLIIHLSRFTNHFKKNTAPVKIDKEIRVNEFNYELYG